jgi:hypothetical protein
MGACQTTAKSSHAVTARIDALESKCSKQNDFLSSRLNQKHKEHMDTCASQMEALQQGLRRDSTTSKQDIEQLRQRIDTEVQSRFMPQMNALQTTLNQVQARASQLNNDMDKLQERMQTAEREVATQRKAHEMQNRFLASCTNHDDWTRRVTLIVGEITFNTNVATLLNRQSMLAHLVKYENGVALRAHVASTKHLISQSEAVQNHQDDIAPLDAGIAETKLYHHQSMNSRRSESMQFFIDRPSTHFETLLNFLRTGTCPFFFKLLHAQFCANNVNMDNINTDLDLYQVMHNTDVTEEWSALWLEVQFYYIEDLIEAKELHERAYHTELTRQFKEKLRKAQEAQEAEKQERARQTAFAALSARQRHRITQLSYAY